MDVKPEKSPAEITELAVLLKRAESGDRSVLPDLRKILEDNPDFWRSYGDLAAQAQGSLIELSAGNNLLMAESLQHKLEEMKVNLFGEYSSPLEKLLVERILATWVQTTYFDALLAQSVGCSEARTRMIQKQQDSAHRRHLTSIKMLATVHKLLAPVLHPIDIATRLEKSGPTFHRQKIAGKVPVLN